MPMPPPTITYDAERIFHFVNQRAPLHKVEGYTAIGLQRSGQLIAGVVYDGYTGSNIFMHVAAEPGARWMTKAYLLTCFAYPFITAGCQRITGMVAASNTQARRFDEHLGFEQEALLPQAGPDGDDLLLYVMWRDKCRFLKHLSTPAKGNHHG